MATRRAWMDLARETVDSFDSRDVADLYSIEWAEARDVLASEHREAIEKERPGWRRELLRTSALLHGLVRRLSPARRLVVLVVLVGFVITFLKLVTGGWPADATWSVFTLLVCTVLLLLLLGLELVDKLRFRDELVMARQLQAELVPQSLPAIPGFELGAFNRVANTVGGDLYEFQPLENGGLAILFGDASGHGMAAGLVMAVAHTAWRLQLERDPSPEAVLATLNRVLCRLGTCRTSGPRQFFAGVSLLLQPDGSFVAAIAGHPPVLRVGTGGTVLERFGRGAYPLGVKQAQAYEVETGRLGPGELLLLHSDGLSEARDADGREFGDGRILATLSRMPGRSAADVAAALSGEVLAFLGRRPVGDDVSIAVLRRSPG
jgi:serine phosphatase RsbU (regulator of sigma subunit)